MNKNLSHSEQQGDATIFPTVCFLHLFFEESDNDFVMKVFWHYLFFPYISQDVVLNQDVNLALLKIRFTLIIPGCPSPRHSTIQ